MGCPGRISRTNLAHPPRDSRDGMSGYRNTITQELMDVVIWGFVTSPMQIRRFRMCLGCVLDYAERIFEDIEMVH